MHGYEPPERSEEGSWGDILALTIAVFQALFAPLLVIAIVLGLSIATIMALFTNPPVALLPIAMLVLLTVYFVRRDKRAQEEMEREVGTGGPPGV